MSTVSLWLFHFSTKAYEVIVRPKVEPEWQQAQQHMAELQFGGLQRFPDSGKVEPTLR